MFVPVHLANNPWRAAMKIKSTVLASLSFTKIIKPRQADGSLYGCPCCGSPTLGTRGGDEVCRVCIWQDLGQDDPFADEVWGGPNGKLSLTEARKNFRQCGAYDPRIGRGPATSRPPAPEPPPATSPRPRPTTPPPAPPAATPSPRRAAPPPAPPTAPPSPPWWARLSRRQQITLLAETVAVLLIALCAYWFATGRLTGQMVKDRGYYLWTHEQAPYKPEYAALFARDAVFQRRFLGKPVDSLHRFFPWLYYGGARYDPDAHRLVNPGHSFPSYKGAQIRVYRLDFVQGGMAYCVLVVDGQIKDFFFATR